ncbi:HAMP domain-containing sensor histidine kinase [Bacillus alkalisoli]|uniref:HAMP domain-containing sensor histidine kinase n=1 Tax=Bacillus alkalisoli TaxID=2011008 RepID=UPI000C243BE2|nr:HAMP domain-containing histidine kinase [Bacillus alkalisoli]
MMKIAKLYGHLPIRWKLAIWSSIVLFVLFVTYNSLQYYVLRTWMLDQEERNIQEKMKEIHAYFSDKPYRIDRTEIINSSRFLERASEMNELIRIFDKDGNLVVAVAAPGVARELIVTPIYNKDLEHFQMNGKHYLVHRTPFITPSFIGYIEIVRDLKNYERLRGLIFLVNVSAGAGAILLSGIGGMLIAKQLLRPIAALTETIRRIKSRGLKERVAHNINNRDEISELTSMFNGMMDDVESSFQKQKQFVEDASHELRTPISILEGHLKLLNRWGKNDPAVLEESLEASQQEVERLKKLVLELLELTRLESDRFEIAEEQIHPTPVIENIIQKMRVVHPEFEFTFANEANIENVQVKMAERHMEQLLIILLDNAIKYSGESKKMDVAIQHLKDSGEVAIEVKDYGIGIPKEEIQHIFDRFYRVDKARSRDKGGHGLGLSIAKRMVNNYSGKIFASSEEGSWTTFTIILKEAKDNF